MKYFLPLLLFLPIISCRQNKQPESLVIDNLKYSAYAWHLGSDKFKFYLAHYLDMDKNGHFILMRHEKIMDSPKYFTGDISEKLRKAINATFKDDNYSLDYSIKPEDSYIYDGFTYCIDYKKKDSAEKKIQFIPNKSPEKIKQINLLLDTLIYISANIKMDSFNTEKYANDLANFSLQVSRPLPKIEKPSIESKIINKNTANNNRIGALLYLSLYAVVGMRR